MPILDQEIADLVEGRLDLDRVRELQSETKDPDRRERVIRAWQARVPWKDTIELCLQEGLFIVKHGPQRIVKCACGQEFCEYHTNWKEHALVYERDPQDGEVYAPANSPDVDWMILREFYCPGCAMLLDTEGVPKGYPFIFNFLPFFPDDDAVR
jgi:acetone carboxylase, gamma subunit